MECIEVASHAHAEESFDWNLDDEDDASSAVEVTAESVAALEAASEKPVLVPSTASAAQADVVADGAVLPPSIPVHQEIVTASPEIEADAPREVSPRKIQPEAEAGSAEGSAPTTAVTTTDEEQAIQLPQDDADAWEWE